MFVKLIPAKTISDAPDAWSELQAGCQYLTRGDQEYPQGRVVPIDVGEGDSYPFKGLVDFDIFDVDATVPTKNNCPIYPRNGLWIHGTETIMDLVYRINASRHLTQEEMDTLFEDWTMDDLIRGAWVGHALKGRTKDPLEGEHYYSLPENTEDKDKIVAIVERLKDTLLAKNQDYGSTASRSPLLVPSLSPCDAIMVRMSDKIARIQQLSSNPAKVDESLSDTVLDLAGYCVLWLVSKNA